VLFRYAVHFVCMFTLPTEMGALLSWQFHSCNGVNNKWAGTSTWTSQVLVLSQLQQWFLVRPGDSCCQTVCAMLSAQV